MPNPKTIAILATLDTKGAEAQFLRDELKKQGGRGHIIDMGVIGQASVPADTPREEVARKGGTELSVLLQDPKRETATPVMVAGAIALLMPLVERGEIAGILGLGGFQGTGVSAEIMRAMPYGLPKVLVSTAASGDVAAYVDTKDITMMFSVGDILGLNRFTRKILANAAGAALGMAQVSTQIQLGDQSTVGQKPLIGMTNLGVLTKGAIHALECFEAKGYEVIVFHAIGSGGRAMEQMIEDGIIGAVFDYAMGEIADEVFGVLRAGGPERLRIAGRLGLPQVLCPGGAEHLGILVEPHKVPEEWKDHNYVFHNPVVFVPRLSAAEFSKVAEEIGTRLQETKGQAVFMLPLEGTGSYAAPGGDLRDEESDRAFFQSLKDALPDSIEVIERATHAEDPKFVEECVDRLIGLIEA